MMHGGWMKENWNTLLLVTFQPICLQCITTYGLQRKPTTIYCLERWCKEFERESLINWWRSALLIQSAAEMHNEDWPLQGHSAKKRLELGMPSPLSNRPWQDRQTDRQTLTKSEWSMSLTSLGYSWKGPPPLFRPRHLSKTNKINKKYSRCFSSFNVHMNLLGPC